MIGFGLARGAIKASGRLPENAIPTGGKIYQPFGMVNVGFSFPKYQNRAILPFFEFGTPPAE
jgi:hypothetical protein